MAISHNIYKASKERFNDQNETIGFCNWEQNFPNFKLECWNMKNAQGNVEPVIVQIWPHGRGYSIYAMKTFYQTSEAKMIEAPSGKDQKY